MIKVTIQKEENEEEKEMPISELIRGQIGIITKVPGVSDYHQLGKYVCKSAFSSDAICINDISIWYLKNLNGYFVKIINNPLSILLEYKPQEE